MEFLDYTCFVEGLAADASKVDFNARLLTTILGLTGEAAECVEIVCDKNAKINRDKLVDECSDLMWYVAFGTIVLEVSLTEIIEKYKWDEGKPAINNGQIVDEVMMLSCAAGRCADITKKHLFHSKPFNKPKLLQGIEDVVKHITNVAALLGLTVQDVVDVNVVKLKDRYKTGKFTFEEFMKKETA